MNLVHDYVPLEIIASADLNTIQANALGIIQANYQFLGEPPVIATNADGTQLSIGAFSVCINNVVLSAATTIITIGAEVTTDNLRYYVYAYSNSGSLAFARSTSPPDNTGQYENADPTRRLITTFLGTGATTCIPYVQRGRRYRYRMNGERGEFNALKNLRVLSAGAATTSTGVLIPTAVSPNAISIELDVYCVNGGNFDTTLFGSYGDTVSVTGAETGSTFQDRMIIPASGAVSIWPSKQMTIPTPNYSAGFSYLSNLGSPFGNTPYVDVVGWDE